MSIFIGWKKDFRSVTDQERGVIRRDAIRMIKKVIALFYGVHVNTVRDWWKLYKKEGSKSLSFLKRGAKSENKKLLNPSQELKIQKMITDIMPDQLKLDLTRIKQYF